MRDAIAGDFAELEPLLPSTRRDQVVEALRSAILQGQLAPGSQLIEQRLAERFRVSRAPLREAIRDLADEGLLDVRPYVGTFVASLGRAEMGEVYSVRRALEAHAIRLCWPHRDAIFARILRARHAALADASATGGFSDEIRAELQFHTLPFAYSRNGLLQQMWRQIAQRIMLGFCLYRRVASACTEQKGVHARYLELALGDDLEAMLAEVDRHIDLGLVSVNAYFDACPDASEAAS